MHYRSLLFLTVFVCMGALAVHAQSAVAVDYKQPGAALPPLRVLSYHSQSAGANAKTESAGKKKYMTGDDFARKANTFVMIFNPGCGHCEDETELLEKNIGLFTRSKIVMVANPAQWAYLPNFAKSFHIADYPAISIGIDSSGYIDNTFFYKGLPQINIYDRHHKLLKIFSGDIVMDSLKPYIQ